MTSALDQDEIETGLRRKGFKESYNNHKYFVLYFNNKKEAGTFLSHGKNRDIGNPLLSAMARELGISSSEFVDLIKCPLSTTDYLDKKAKRLEEGLRILKRG
ncbi:MAG: hypothetical protein JW986_07810 [Methanotrichaceae archaeon]|nr:hypothetical protein [Methanotrichaceae archaeon]